MQEGAGRELWLVRCVLLEHRLGDGSFHHDWMLDLDGEPGLLATFQVAGRVDLLREGTFRARRIGDHRRIYLNYEGPISGGRGAVTRVAAGRGSVLSRGEEGLAVMVDWGSGPVRLEGRDEGGGAWLFALGSAG